MRYQVDHVTRIVYDGMVRLARFNLRLQPAAWPGQTVSDFNLSVDPTPLSLLTRQGPYPVNVTRVEIDHPIDALTIRCQFIAQVENDMLDMPAQDLPVARIARTALEAATLGPWAPAHYLFTSPLLPPLPEIAQWARDLLPHDASAVEGGLALCRRIQQDFRYDPDATETDTPVGRAFAMRHGVCQDFAHILIVALRSAGIPAAYVSGYLRTLPPPGQPRLVGVDAMHAWVALWGGPQRGWVGLDPTNGCMAGADHIFAALGRDYSDVAPIDGMFVGGSAQKLTTSVDVMPLAD